MTFYLMVADGPVYAYLTEDGQPCRDTWGPPENVMSFETRWEAEEFVDDNLNLDLIICEGAS